MKILVPVKRVSDPDNANKVKVAADGKAVTTDGLEWKLNPFDEYAVETALRLNENAKGNEKLGETVVVTLGPKEAVQQLRQALAMVPSADHVGPTTARLSVVAARALKAIVTRKSPTWCCSARCGYWLSMPPLDPRRVWLAAGTFAMSLATDGGKSLTVGREVDTGVLTVKVQTPAVVSVDLRIVAPKAVQNGVTPAAHEYGDGARYASLKGIMQAKKKPVAEEKLDALGVDGGLTTTYTKFELPPARKAGVTVESVDELIGKLKNEAKVI